MQPAAPAAPSSGGAGKCSPCPSANSAPFAARRSPWSGRSPPPRPQPRVARPHPNRQSARASAIWVRARNTGLRARRAPARPERCARGKWRAVRARQGERSLPEDGAAARPRACRGKGERVGAGFARRVATWPGGWRRSRHQRARGHGKHSKWRPSSRAGESVKFVYWRADGFWGGEHTQTFSPTIRFIRQPLTGHHPKLVKKPEGPG